MWGAVRFVPYVKTWAVTASAWIGLSYQPIPLWTHWLARRGRNRSGSVWSKQFFSVVWVQIVRFSFSLLVNNAFSLLDILSPADIVVDNLKKRHCSYYVQVASRWSSFFCFGDFCCEDNDCDNLFIYIFFVCMQNQACVNLGCVTTVVYTTVTIVTGMTPWSFPLALFPTGISSHRRFFSSFKFQYFSRRRFVSPDIKWLNF